MSVEYDANIEDKVEEYHTALKEYGSCIAQENFSKQETLKARTRLNLAEGDLRALRQDMNYSLATKLNTHV